MDVQTFMKAKAVMERLEIMEAQYNYWCRCKNLICREYSFEVVAQGEHFKATLPQAVAQKIFDVIVEEYQQAAAAARDKLAAL